MWNTAALTSWKEDWISSTQIVAISSITQRKLQFYCMLPFGESFYDTNPYDTPTEGPVNDIASQMQVQCKRIYI